MVSVSINKIRKLFHPSGCFKITVFGRVASITGSSLLKLEAISEIWSCPCQLGRTLQHIFQLCEAVGHTFLPQDNDVILCLKI